MTDSRIFIFVNGIRSNPDDAAKWTDRAVSWCLNRGISADKYEYDCWALTRRLREQWHAQQLVLTINRYEAKRIVLVGHSNGCELICRALKLCRPRIDHAFLIAGACDERFNKNGLNDAVTQHKLGEVSCFCSHDDKVLGLARLTAFLRFVGLGYGWLGLVGPQKITPLGLIERHVAVEWFPGYDHSDYFAGDNFEITMRCIEEATQ